MPHASQAALHNALLRPVMDDRRYPTVICTSRLYAVICLVAFAVFGASSPAAIAGPISGPFWDEDTPFRVVVRFQHGPVLSGNDFHPFNAISPSGFWHIRVGFGETGNDPVPLDTVRIGDDTPTEADSLGPPARIEHLHGPHPGEDGGAPFLFRLALIPPTPAGIIGRRRGFVSHPGFDPTHGDLFTATAVAFVDPTDESQIQSYSL